VRILTINCGSSTLKFELFEVADEERSIARGVVDRIGGRGSAELISESGERTVRSISAADHGEATLQVIRLLASSGLLGGLQAVGHRVVHGGARFSGPTLLDTGAEDAIEELAELAPLHNGPALAAIRAITEALGPEMSQVATFDTAFHSRMPRVARLFALPRQLADEGVLRYGFHGISYEYVMGRLRALDPEVDADRILIAHLGNGASMVAVRGGVGVDTTMGFTPTGGLVMGTRSGDLDPGVLGYLLEERVVGLVYVSAFAPDEGETLADIESDS